MAESSMSVSVRPKVRSGLAMQKFDEPPLDKRMIKFEDREGLIRTYPALHTQFSQTMMFPLYSSPPLKTLIEVGDEMDQNQDIQNWFSRVKSYQTMLSDLLRLPHHRFWSTIVYNKSLHTSLDSYIRHAQRSHDARKLLVTDKMRCLVQEIHILFFKVHLRMSTHKESPKDHITPSVFGQLIYDNYLFDIPKMMDLCVLYVRSSEKTAAILRDMLSNVFNNQPRYAEDLAQSSNDILNALRMIEDKLDLKKDIKEKEKFSSAAKITKLNKKTSSISATSKYDVPINWSELRDTIFYLTDISVTVRMFVFAYPPAAKIYHSERLENKIVEFYCKTFPILTKQLDERFKANQDESVAILEGLIKEQVITARSSLLNLFRDIIKISCIDQLHDPNIESEMKACIIDELIEMLSVAALEKSFITDYASAFPFENDLKALKENSDVTGFAFVDQDRIDFVLSLISGNSMMNLEDDNVGVDTHLNFNDNGDSNVIANGQPKDEQEEEWPIIDNNVQDINTPFEDVPTHERFMSKKKSIDTKLDQEEKEKIKMLAAKIQEDEILRYNAEYDDEYDDTYEDDTHVDLISDKMMDEIVGDKYANHNRNKNRNDR